MYCASLVFLALVASVRSEEPQVSVGGHTAGASVQPLGEGKLLVSKFLLSSYAVESKDLIIDYRIYNVGDKAALRVTLDDRHNFPTNYFDIERGLLQVKWDRIPAGANVSHSVAIRPRQAGTFNYTSAVVTYLASEDAGELRTSYSSAPGEGYIYYLKEKTGVVQDYERKFSPHVVDWLIWALMALPTLALPAMLWRKSAAKYTLTDSKKKAH